MMPSLLNLPREIRDYILDLALFTPSWTAQDLSCYNSQRRELEDTDSKPWNRGSYLVKYLPQHQSHHGSFLNSTSLLLLNHQLNAETSNILQKKKPSYILDVACINELELWPTWTSVPFLSRKVDEVYVPIRMVTTTKLGWTAKTNRWLGGDGIPPLAWGFASMLHLFLIYGPVMDHLKKQEESDKTISIRRLVLDVQTPTEVSNSSSNLVIGPYNSEAQPPHAKYQPIKISPTPFNWHQLCYASRNIVEPSCWTD